MTLYAADIGKYDVIWGDKISDNMSNKNMGFYEYFILQLLSYLHIIENTEAMKGRHLSRNMFRSMNVISMYSEMVMYKHHLKI